MFLPFFDQLRKHGVPVSMREFLAFLEGMSAGLATYDVEAFYYLARIAMVKDERNLDRFDQAFAKSFEGLESIAMDDVLEAIELPQEWLEKMAEKFLSPEEMAQIVQHAVAIFIVRPDEGDAQRAGEPGIAFGDILRPRAHRLPGVVADPEVEVMRPSTPRRGATFSQKRPAAPPPPITGSSAGSRNTSPPPWPSRRLT